MFLISFCVSSLLLYGPRLHTGGTAQPFPPVTIVLRMQAPSRNVHTDTAKGAFIHIATAGRGSVAGL